MYFDQHEHQRAREHHEQLLVEARILRLIRSATRPERRPQPRRKAETLAARVGALLRQRRSASA
jgi:hypothetical protein